MKTYVVNLADRTDRLRHMEAELGRLGVGFDHFPAVDAKSDPAVAEWADRGVSKAGYTISDGAVACGLSHRRIWEMFLAGEDAFCAVLEDDVFLSDRFAACLTPDWVPDDADLVKLETTISRTHLARAAAYAGPEGSIYRLIGRHVCTGAYIVSRKGAERLLAATWPPTEAVDEVMFNPDFGWSGKAVIYQLSPAVAIQAENLDAAPADSSVADSSIVERSIESAAKPVVETGLQRLIRRATNEVRALAQGTRYSVVPFVR